jgi:signal transduction histidine kinase
LIAFDLPTAYFIAGILYVVMPITVGLLLRKDSTGTVLPWCAGGVVFGMSLVLLGSRKHLPYWASYPLANGLLFAGTALRATALRLALGRPLHKRWLALACVAFVGVYESLNAVSPIARFIWGSGVASATLIWLGLLAKDVHRRDQSFSAIWVSRVYLALGGVLALRALIAATGWEDPDVLSLNPLSVLMVLFGVLAAIVGNLGFMGIFLERLSRTNLEQATQQARQEEAARLGDQIAQLDRRRSVGEIAASLAHELSQPLTNIYLIADRLGMALEKTGDASLAQYLSDIHRNTQKAGDILGRIRAFIRSKETVFERVALGQVISDVTALINDLANNESVRLEVTLPAQNVWVRGDPVQLSQILMNVCRNAIQATQGQSERWLHLRVWRADGMACVEITDNGPGMQPEVLASVSTPFFSTKPDGLGVGLSISKSIAKHHGGTLSIDNHPDGGAVVVLQLPSID